MNIAMSTVHSSGPFASTPWTGAVVDGEVLDGAVWTDAGA